MFGEELDEGGIRLTVVGLGAKIDNKFAGGRVGRRGDFDNFFLR